MIARRASILLLIFSLGVLPVSPGAGTHRLVGLSEFKHLMIQLSEPEGYFDTDNFISNERAYLKILTDLRRNGLRGGAYLGVGPDQNYSYIAEVQPQIAIIVDIRRQNALEHLYFKSLFQLSRSRAQFLERLFGRNIDRSAFSSKECSISELLRRIDDASQNKAFEAERETEAVRIIQSWNLDLTRADYASIHLVARAFFQNGLDLKFTSYNRPPRPDYPSYRQLLLETDSNGTQCNYLATEERFLFVKQLHQENRVIPIVGDLGGEAALRQTAEELRKWKIPLRCLYVSNVEFYLFGSERWKRYVQNVSHLPRDPGALLIRSYASSWQPSPPHVPGYYMGTQLTTIDRFLRDELAGSNKNYWDLVLRAQSPWSPVK
jgi:hypothetical protein